MMLDDEVRHTKYDELGCRMGYEMRDVYTIGEFCILLRTRISYFKHHTYHPSNSFTTALIVLPSA
jgi:hypothetical protein